MKWFTKGEIFTTCCNVDLNRSASEKKTCAKMSIFKPCQKDDPPPLVNDNEQGPPGEGGREKLITFLLRGKMIFCYRVNRFLTVSLLSEIFNKTPIFKEKIVPKNAISGPNSPPPPPPLPMPSASAGFCQKSNKCHSE